MQRITLPALLPQDPVFLRVREVDDKWALVCLLAWAAQHRPDGDLRDLGEVAIAGAAGLTPISASGFVEEMMEAGAITCDEDGYRIADALLPAKARNGGDKAPSCPVEKIVQAYHDSLPMLARVRTMSPATRVKLVNAWKADPQRQDVTWWVSYFRYVAEKCPFLIGRAGGDRPFSADFTWLVGPTNMEKVVNGRYEARS